MNQREIGELLDRPLLAVISSVDAAANPHAVPVWYRYDGAAIKIWTGEDRAWVQHLRSRPKAAIAVCDSSRPFSAAGVISGAAAVRHEDDEETLAEIRAITARYVPADEVETVVARFPDLRTIVSIRADRVRAWPEL